MTTQKTTDTAKTEARVLRIADPGPETRPSPEGFVADESDATPTHTATEETEVTVEAEPQPYTELDTETAKAVSEHLIIGLKDGSVIAEEGEMHPLMVQITLAEYRRLVSENARLTGMVSDTYAQRIRADQLEREVAELRKSNGALTERLIQTALKGVGGNGQ